MHRLTSYTARLKSLGLGASVDTAWRFPGDYWANGITDALSIVSGEGRFRPHCAEDRVGAQKRWVRFALAAA